MCAVMQFATQQMTSTVSDGAMGQETMSLPFFIWLLSTPLLKLNRAALAIWTRQQFVVGGVGYSMQGELKVLEVGSIAVRSLCSRED